MTEEGGGGGKGKGKRERKKILQINRFISYGFNKNEHEFDNGYTKGGEKRKTEHRLINEYGNAAKRLRKGHIRRQKDKPPQRIFPPSS